LTRVVISDLRDGTYYAYLQLDRDGEVLYIDARPSDALALSLRTTAPVFVESSVMERTGSIDSSSEADNDRLQRWLESLDPDDLGYKM
jgi:bifunctional DNase/RNase